MSVRTQSGHSLRQAAWLCGLMLLVGTATGPTAAASPASSTNTVPKADTATYLGDVLPILMGKCYRCHNEQVSLTGNWLDYKTAFSDRREIKRRVWDAWQGRYFKQPMPAGFSPELHAMTDEERLTIKHWVEAGAPYGVPPTISSPKSRTERIELGRRMFATICSACHQPGGQGIPNRFPPLAGSDFLNADKKRAIGVLLKGLQGEVIVNGQKFNNSMPPLPLADGEIASALTFVYSSFGNSGQDVTPEEVKALRGASDDARTHGELANRGNAAREVSPWE
jgi:mono/diheme cytochrome c family protein